MPNLGDIRNVRWGDDMGTNIVGEVFEKRTISNAFQYDHVPQQEVSIEVLFQDMKVDPQSEGAIAMRQAVGDTVSAPDVGAAQSFVLEQQNQVERFFSFSVPFGDPRYDTLVADHGLVAPPFFVQNAKFTDEEETRVSFEFRLSEDDDWQPYLTTSVEQPDNPEAHRDARIFHLVEQAGAIEAYTPPPYDAEAAKAQAKSSVLAFIDNMDASINAQYTKTEREGWAALAEEAQAFLADPEAPAIGLRLQADIKGVEVADLAETILALAAFNSILASIAGGIRSKADAMIDASDGSPEALQEILTSLQERAAQVLSATQARDEDALKAAVTGW